jgi:hypothetical protein
MLNKNKSLEQKLKKQIEQSKDVTSALKKMLIELERQQQKKVKSKKK